MICFVIVSFLMACHSGSKKEDKKVFTLNLDQGLTSLDPAFARNQNVLWMTNQIFNGLVQIDDSLQIKPCVAKSWEISADGKQYIFHLRNDVYFHDDALFPNKKGRKVNAGDFKYSFSRIIDPKTASSGSWIFSDKVDGEEAFIATNDSTLIIQLNKPFPPFLAMLSGQYCSVIPFEVAEHYGKEFRNHPIGTGPFKFKYWKEGEVLVLLKNENYFERDADGVQLPYLDAVKATFIPDKQTAFMEFIKKKLDFFNSIDGSYRDDILTKSGKMTSKYEGKFQMVKGPYLNTEYLGILVDSNLAIVKNSPLKYKKIRQAINYAINKERLVKYLRNSIGIPGSSGFIPAGMPGFDAKAVKGYSYNPAKARQLLKEAGFPNGKGMSEITLSTTTTYKDLIEFIQGELNNVGIKTKIEVNQSASLREVIAKRQVNFFRGSWIADYADGEIYLSMFYSKNYVPIGPNYTSFNHKEFDVLFEQLNFVKDDEERFKLYQKMDQLVMDEAPVVVLFYDEFINMYQNNISGFSKNAQNLVVLKKVKKD
ncbi:ABC transporter substrate-binding protein [Pedobacter cryophilus]|uniref:ABC transporter substrate-binding protein n=1 Tax=Pedobacter cryophilus TaxID=2571271 RepID=A0A4V5NWU9_9SPHI|nr:ABC transporter substrate-binding protein [Pedobacter cryophilus]TKB96363.1 ABC transporter substrate-binding protein [Pedobacter cryophilus]